MSVESKINQISQDLRKVGLTPLSTKSNGIARSKQVVADSWEDEVSDNDEETKSPVSDQSVPLEAPGPTHLKSPTSRAVDAERELDGHTHNLPDVPPPTPIFSALRNSTREWSPSKGARDIHPLASNTSSDSSSPQPPLQTLPANPSTYQGTPDLNRDGERRRPEKTTATANRLIAGALGIKAPPKTEEQRKYERAVKEQEIKRRNKEKEQKAKEAAEEETAKAAMWD